jgi:FixJ family two-component response regulator
VSERDRTIAIVDNDERVIGLPQGLLESASYLVRTVSSPGALIDALFCELIDEPVLLAAVRKALSRARRKQCELMLTRRPVKVT